MPSVKGLQLCASVSPSARDCLRLPAESGTLKRVAGVHAVFRMRLSPQKL